VSPLSCIRYMLIGQSATRLRQVDVKAEHFERQVQRAEQERDLWEKKYEVHKLYHVPSLYSSIHVGIGSQVSSVQE